MTLLKLTVPTSQAVIGAVRGVGLVKEGHTIWAKVLAPPRVACFPALGIPFAIHLRYIP